MHANQHNTPNNNARNHAQRHTGRHIPASKLQPVANGILANEKTQALQQLIKITQNLNDLAERESQALAQNDMLSFAILQDEKALIAEHYTAASTEFRGRLNEFRGITPALLDRLEGLQNRLGELSKHNNETIKRIYAQAKKNTQDTLISAQELGQKKPLKLSRDEA